MYSIIAFDSLNRLGAPGSTFFSPHVFASIYCPFQQPGICLRKDIRPTSEAVSRYIRNQDPTDSRKKREQRLETLARVGVILCEALLRNLQARPVIGRFAVGMDVEVLRDGRFKAAKVVEVHKGPDTHDAKIKATRHHRGRELEAAGPEEQLVGVLTDDLRVAGDAHAVYNLMLHHRTFERLSAWQHAVKGADNNKFVASELRWLHVHTESYRQAMREGARANAFEILSILVTCYDAVRSASALPPLIHVRVPCVTPCLLRTERLEPHILCV